MAILITLLALVGIASGAYVWKFQVKRIPYSAKTKTDYDDPKTWGV